MPFEIENDEDAEKKQPVKPVPKTPTQIDLVEDDDDLGLGDENEPELFPHSHPDPIVEPVPEEVGFTVLPEIEKGIPIPDIRGFKKTGKPELWRVMLERMEVGDSVFLAGTPLRKSAHLNKLARGIGLRITQRSMDGGVRIWLKEKMVRVITQDPAPGTDPSDIGV